ncbi:DUF2612 domain-containing protein [Acetobacter orientalis]|uniref:Burkholderia phage Bcep781 gp32 n=1 Tax=Acetobacter orientalis TaxID=146474 RepID=A0A2Z5ZJH4_9PROT|nr:DUF2612 domain-containing protein [Acetobacter orientalis]MCP1217100.1 DUF2612 domain-containing protein [Acetobacter orientalis]MCP1220004.1 DUF2612 domain-containing protein [Acetobacter orientalis]BBC80882.1 Burkholderia phage Bcep781 gp32 [Acetobacter orientalis]GAN66830.1 hypothetical protein Abor_030_005 [Acetobacter orientalis]GBR21895.1 hypothetical protein AA0481_2493 [Acetobacter orientalis NRIC 0481]
MRDVQKTVLSQYSCAPTLNALIEAWNQTLDPTRLIETWFTNIWNLDTAQGYGLDVWGRIVGVERVLTLSTDSFFGFAEPQDLTLQPFNAAPWYSGTQTTSNYRLSDDAFRQLINAKALANITDGSITSLNAILMTLFAGQGDVWVADTGTMTLTYTFNFAPSAVQVSLIQSSGVLMRPAGVRVIYAIKPQT